MAIKKGNSFANSIVGTSLADQLFGMAGNDRLLQPPRIYLSFSWAQEASLCNQGAGIGLYMV